MGSIFCDLRSRWRRYVVTLNIKTTEPERVGVLLRLSPMQKPISQIFLETAQSDLSVARFLYQNGDFPHAIFSLQQSVEKTIKALGLQAGLVSFDELSKKIGHKAFRLAGVSAKATAEQTKSVLQLIEAKHPVLEFLPAMPKKDFQKYLDKLRSSEAKIWSIQPTEYSEPSDEELSELFQAFQTTSEISFEFVPEEFRDFIDLWLDDVSQKSLIAQNEIDEAKIVFSDLENIQLMVEAVQKAIRIEIWFAHILIPLSIITSAHESGSRYPCAECGHHPTEYYQKGLPIVDRFEELAEWQSKCLEVIQQFIDNK
jgi:HEPN domain-containing protein